jgi:aspartate/methionine/tyrosine aminotransferase
VPNITSSLELLKENGFFPEIAAIPAAILKRTALAYICSPANPQGAVAPLSYLTEWLKLARAHNFVLASDECYSEIYRGTPPHGALEAARDSAARWTTSSSSPGVQALERRGPAPASSWARRR